MLTLSQSRNGAETKMKVVNLIGGPGSGKSTTAAGVFHHLKLMGATCELVTEYAKDLSYERRNVALGNQAYVFGKQLQRFHVLDGIVDLVVTDSPPILGLLYAPEWYPPSFGEFVRFMVGRYDNRYYLLNRKKPFVQDGRHHSESESIELDARIKRLFDEHSIPYTAVDGDESAVGRILEDLAREVWHSGGELHR